LYENLNLPHPPKRDTVGRLSPHAYPNLKGYNTHSKPRITGQWWSYLCRVKSSTSLTPSLDSTSSPEMPSSPPSGYYTNSKPSITEPVVVLPVQHEILDFLASILGLHFLTRDAIIPSLCADYRSLCMASKIRFLYAPPLQMPSADLCWLPRTFLAGGLEHWGGVSCHSRGMFAIGVVHMHRCHVSIVTLMLVQDMKLNSGIL